MCPESEPESERTARGETEEAKPEQPEGTKPSKPVPQESESIELKSEDDTKQESK